jgi:hypothetical protein
MTSSNNADLQSLIKILKEKDIIKWGYKFTL